MSKQKKKETLTKDAIIFYLSTGICQYKEIYKNFEVTITVKEIKD